MADGDAARQPIARLAEDVVNRIAAGEVRVQGAGWVLTRR